MGDKKNILKKYEKRCGPEHDATSGQQHVQINFLRFVGSPVGILLDPHLAVCQNLVPLVNIKIAGKWMFIPLKMILIGIDPYPSPGLRSCVPRWRWRRPTERPRLGWRLDPPWKNPPGLGWSSPETLEDQPESLALKFRATAFPSFPTENVFFSCFNCAFTHLLHHVYNKH